MHAAPDPERVAVWRGLGQLVEDVRRELDAEMTAVHELPLAWFEVLSALRDAGGTLRVIELADQLGDVVSSTSRRLARMERDGLVDRPTAPVPATTGRSACR